MIRDEQLSIRKTFIGGSDVAAVLGISPWKTPYALWLEKTGQTTDEPHDEQRTRILNRGKRLEPVVLEMLSDETGIEITACNCRYIDCKHDFMSCEIDAEAGDTNIEIKTVSPFAARHWGEPGTDEIPVWYTAQVMYGLALTGRQECIVAALIGADDLRIHRVKYDDEAAQLCRDRVIRFWHENVIGCSEPEPVNLDDVRRMFSKDTGAEVIADADIEVSVLRLHGIAEQMKLLEREADVLKLQIQRYMAGCSTLIGRSVNKKIATWKTQSSSRLDQKALAESHPEIVKKFKRVTETRVFRLC